jgi:hypothetical protein
VGVIVVGLEAAEWRYLIGDDRTGGVRIAEGHVVGGAGGAGEGGEDRQHRERQDRCSTQPPRVELDRLVHIHLLSVGTGTVPAL